MKKLLVAVLLAASFKEGNSAPFQNLGFDEANTNGVGVDSFGPATQLLPGWRLSSVIREETLIGYNVSLAGLNFATLYDMSYSRFGTPPPVEGKYGLGLWPGPASEDLDAPYHLSQTGDIPGDAKTIHFTDFAGPFELRVNGELVPLVYYVPPNYPPPLFNRGVPVPVVGDISAFAGKTAELEFTTVAIIGPSDALRGIDSIFFSPDLIPEPSTWALCGLAGLYKLSTSIRVEFLFAAKLSQG